MKPTAADIAIVIGKIEAGDWLDPSEEPISWSCVLYDPKGALAACPQDVENSVQNLAHINRALALEPQLHRGKN